jgi:hypothetical protein
MGFAMDVQQIITWLLVGLASLYLARIGVKSWKAMWSARGGCGSGCGKCVTAEIAAHRHTAATPGSSRQVIPLSAVGRPPAKRDE